MSLFARPLMFRGSAITSAGAMFSKLDSVITLLTHRLGTTLIQLADCWLGGGGKADAVVEAPYAVFGINALDCEHRCKDLRLSDGGGIAREQRLNEEWSIRLDHEMNAITGNVDARHAFNDLV